MLYSVTIEMADQLARHLDRRVARLTRLLRGEGAAAGLSVTALQLLARLDDGGPQRVTDLAAAELVAQPTMTALVGRLEARGLVTREHTPEDRRAVLVCLTDSGRRALGAVRDARAAALTARLARLSREDRAALAAAVPALDHLLSDPPDR